jgi:hypothetical protein
MLKVVFTKKYRKNYSQFYEINNELTDLYIAINKHEE